MVKSLNINENLYSDITTLENHHMKILSYIEGCGRGKAAATSHGFCIGTIRLLDVFIFRKYILYKQCSYRKHLNIIPREPR